MNWERVYTINDWYDGPRLGIADVGGVPHIYKSLWIETDLEDEDLFVVTPISAELLKIVLEDWGLWSRFYSHYERLSSEDHERLEQLTGIVDKGMKVDITSARRLRASFRGLNISCEGTEVEWREENL